MILRAFIFCEFGTLFIILILITGSFWSKIRVNWGHIFTTTLIWILIYFGYFMIQKYGGAYEKGFDLIGHIFH